MNSTVWNGPVDICILIFNLSNFKLMQEIIVYLLVILAIFFSVKKYLIPSKKENKCSSDCDCH